MQWTFILESWRQHCLRYSHMQINSVGGNLNRSKFLFEQLNNYFWSQFNDIRIPKLNKSFLVQQILSLPRTSTLCISPEGFNSVVICSTQ